MKYLWYLYLRVQGFLDSEFRKREGDVCVDYPFFSKKDHVRR